MKINSLINERVKTGSSTKMSTMAERSASGNMTTFAGLFSVTELSVQEKESLESILSSFASDSSDIQKDLKQLSAITQEVKAINNQAAILHGERIKKAHTLLTRYKEGAFTAWLIQTYGNRQTPYNLMQYYEFYEELPVSLRSKLELMPRQAVYTLASREGDFSRKLEIVENYAGETKGVLLSLIRDRFPLHEKDRRRQNYPEAAMVQLKKAYGVIEKIRSLSQNQKQAFKEELSQLKELIEAIKVRS